MRRSDAIRFWSLVSATVVMSMFALLFTIFRQEPDDEIIAYNFFKPIDLMFRISTILSYILFATGFAIQVFNSYGINYLFIFECDPNQKMTSHQMYRVAITLLFIQMSCLTFTLVQASFFEAYEYPYWFMFSLMLFLLLYCC